MQKHKEDLSNDLGAIAGLLFEIGSQKLALGSDNYLSETERTKLEKSMEKRHAEIKAEHAEESLHTEMQYHLLKIGKALGYDVICALNDRSKAYNGSKFFLPLHGRFSRNENRRRHRIDYQTHRHTLV